MTLLISTTIVFAESAPVVTNISRPYTYGNYLLQGKYSTLSATVSNSPTSVSFYWNGSYKTAMSTTYTSTGSWAPTSSDYLRGIYPFGSAYYGSPAKFKVSAANSGGTGSKEIDGYVTRGNISSYTSVDPNFYYSDEVSNNLYGRATGYQAEAHGTTATYNCLAYSVDIYTSWQWPVDWPSSSSITLDKMLKYMNGTESGYANGQRRTSGTFYANGSTSWSAFKTKVIYYSNGHFAKVISYNSDGSPAKIMSKWGHWELIQSSTYSPFTSTYGNAKYYFY